jgi:hypothetical protein
LSFALSFMVAAELNGKVEQLFRIQRRINPPSSSGFPADRRYHASQVSKNRANALLMGRVIGEVTGDVKPNVLARFFNGRGRDPSLLRWGGEGNLARNLTSPHLSHSACAPWHPFLSRKKAGENAKHPPFSTYRWWQKAG